MPTEGYRLHNESIVSMCVDGQALECRLRSTHYFG